MRLDLRDSAGRQAAIARDPTAMRWQGPLEFFKGDSSSPTRSGIFCGHVRGAPGHNTALRWRKSNYRLILATNREGGPTARIADPPTRFAGDGDAKQSEVRGVVTLLEVVVGASPFQVHRSRQVRWARILTPCWNQNRQARCWAVGMCLLALGSVGASRVGTCLPCTWRQRYPKLRERDHLRG